MFYGMCTREMSSTLTLIDRTDFLIGVLSMVSEQEGVLSVSLDDLNAALATCVNDTAGLPVRFDEAVRVDDVVKLFDGRAKPQLAFNRMQWKVSIDMSQAYAALLRLREQHGQAYLENLRPYAIRVAKQLIGRFYYA